MSNGKYLEELETKFKKIFKSKYALAVSMVAALHYHISVLVLKGWLYYYYSPYMGFDS